MRFSKYNFVVADGDKYLIYNFVTTSFIALDADTYPGMCATNSYGDYSEVLKKAGIIVDDDFDEDAFVTDLIEQQKSARRNEFNEIVILTTTACNARCFYCYQHRLKPITMEMSTAAALVEFVKKEWANQDKSDELTIRWFGGEPLVNIAVIDNICEKLQEAGIPYKSKMITNGSLFDEHIISKAKTLWHLQSLQITLDGLGEEYNKIKDYKDARTSFEHVINNIHLLLEKKITVSVRINYSVDDIDRAKKIIDYLNTEFQDRTYLSVYCAALREIGKKTIATYKATESPQLILLDYLHGYGFLKKIDRLLPRVKAFPCEAWLPKKYFVFPNGKVFKCQHTISDNDFVPIGDVKQGVENTSVFQLDNFQTPEKCKDCYAFVFCRGGCLSIREQRQYEDGDCYEYKNSFDGLLRLYYKFYKEENQHGNHSLG